MKQRIRIIGGQYRGKLLDFPNETGLRPTPNRIRETLFNWLMHNIRDARCLDAFAGSGALGFEAFSRGARSVTLIEQSDSPYRYIKKIAVAFNAPNLCVVHTDAINYLQTTANVFDVIFLDPPFAAPHLLDCINTIATSAVLMPGGLLYLETPNKLELNTAHWGMLKSKTSGQVTYALYKKAL